MAAKRRVVTTERRVAVYAVITVEDEDVAVAVTGEDTAETRSGPRR